MWMLFVGELRRRWLEYALGMLAITLVIAALVSQRAVEASAESSLHDLAHRLGRNMLVVPATVDLADFHGQRYGSDSLPDTTPAAIRSSAIAQHVQSIEARLYGNVTVGGVPLIVVGQDQRWPALGDKEPALLGGEAARELGLQAGGVLRLGEVTFSILQVKDPPLDGLDRAVFMPLAAAQRVLGRPGKLSALRLGGCWCRVDVPTLAGQVERLLPGTRALTVAGMLAAQKGSLATMKRYSTVLLVTGLAVVGLVVGTLVASQARRRTRELGLLVALGAPPARLALLFMAQAGATGAAGGLAGWLAAMPVSHYLGEHVLGSAIAPPAGLLLPAMALAALVSAAAASIPARRAAALDPTEVLREV